MIDPSPPKFLPPLSWIAALVLCCIVGGGTILLAHRSPSNQPTQILSIVRDVPAYTLLALADVQQVKTNSPPTDSVANLSGAIGHVTQKPLRRGTTLTSSMLVQSPSIPQGWHTLPLPSSPNPPMKLGETVTLVGTKEDAEVATVISQRSIVIGFQNTVVIIAMPPDEARVAVTYLLEKRRLILLGNVR